MDENSDWLCTQAIVDTDNRADDKKEYMKNFGCLVLIDKNEHYELKNGDNTIGRHPLNHIYIEHPSVSMNHAVIQCDSDGVVLLDKGSLNKTRLNKKNLKKDVAYFLDENALLMFGEIEANYYIDSGEPRENKKNKENYNSEHFLLDAIKQTESSNVDSSKIIHNVSRESTPSPVMDLTGTLDKNNSKYLNVICSDNNILSNIQGSNTSKHVITREDTPSPVMDFGSQFSTINKITTNILQSSNQINIINKREDISSPVMDLKLFVDAENKLATPELNNYDILSADRSNINVNEFNETQCLEIENNVLQFSSQKLSTSNISERKKNTQISKFPSCSSNQSDKNNPDDECTQVHVLNDEDQTYYTNKVEDSSIAINSNNTSVLHETCFNDAKCNISNTETIHIQQNKNDFSNCPTQKLDSLKCAKTCPNSIIQSGTQTQNKIINIINTFEADDDDLFASISENVEFVNYSKTLKSNLIDIKNTKSISSSNQINSNANHIIQQIHGFCDKKETNVHNTPSINTFEADDDDIFNCFIKEKSKSQSHDLMIKTNDKENFFNHPTQKISNLKKTNSTVKISSTINEKDTQISLNLPHTSKSNLNASQNNIGSIFDNLTEVTQIDDNDIFINCASQEVLISKNIISTVTPVCVNLVPQVDEDFFNCPTQRVSYEKKINSTSKLSTTIHEEEPQKFTELPQNSNGNTGNFKSCSTAKHKNKTQVPEIDDEDFFNYPTQKLYISNKTHSISKLSSTIHEEETQKFTELPQNSNGNASNFKSCSTGKYENIPQVLEIDDEDFFNCPTQRVSISKKKSSTSKLSSTIHEEETQKCTELPQGSNGNAGNFKSCSTGKSENKTRVPEIDDEDFFNCPTQKLSISNETNSTSKSFSAIHEEAAQKYTAQLESSEGNEKNFKSCSTSKFENKTRNPEIDDEYFFNCPTQKLSISNKTNSTSKLFSTIHEEETQKCPELPQSNNGNAGNFKSRSTGKSENKTRVSEIDDEDFFNCPTQRVSISKKKSSTSKLSSTIHEEETQKCTELPQGSNGNAGNFKSCSTGKSENKTRVPEIDDEDFFNCPTQKLSISNETNSTSKSFSAIHEEAAQKYTAQLESSEGNEKNFKSRSTSKFENKTWNPEIDDEYFFNCPTQKLSISNKTNSTSKLFSTIHEEETQKCPELPQSNNGNAGNFKSRSTGKSENKTRVSEIDDEDFFNCPTQRVSISKKKSSTSKLSSIIHEATQKCTKLPQNSKSNPGTLRSCSTGMYEDETQVPKINDEDFFNCPTQKLSISNKPDTTSKLSSTIHKEETQKCPELPQGNNGNAGNFKFCSTGTSENKTRVPEIDDEDFFNCPTQRVSISKKKCSTSKLSSTIHEEETQKCPELPQSNNGNAGNFKSRSTGKSENKTRVSEIDDEDFFNCPTQKLSISNETNSTSKSFSAIHEEAARKYTAQLESSEGNEKNFKSRSTSKFENKTRNPEIDDEYFFNCPTQKLSISNKTNSTSKLFSTIHEEETQKCPELPQGNNGNAGNFKSCSTGKSENKTLVSEIDDEDFFNCPTQKLSISNVTNSTSKSFSAIHEEAARKYTAQLESNEGNEKNFKSRSTSKFENKTQNPEIDDEYFFNCPTQKLSISNKTNSTLKLFSTIHEEETQKCPELPQGSNGNAGNFKSCSTGKSENKTRVPEIDDEDFFNCPTQKLSISNGTNSTSKSFSALHEEAARKCTAQPQNNIEFNVKLPVVISNNNQYTSTNSKAFVHIREDLHIPYSLCLANKTADNIDKIVNNGLINNTIKSEINIDSPCCSKSISNEGNYLNTVCVKEEPLTDISEMQVSNSHKCKHQSKQLNESSVYSPLIVTNVNNNLLINQHLHPITVSDNNSLNSELSTSSSISSKWKLFWNKKKRTVQNNKIPDDKQECNDSANNVMLKKRHHQTRAVTRKENSVELSKKRKLDNGNFDKTNKRTCEEINNDTKTTLNSLIVNTSEVVVTFSYLKNRHLQEMKQFVDKTGGSITDDITVCTVLVTDKIRCTMKILSAIARGCPIVNTNWLKHSYTVKMFQDVDDFIIMDKDAERKYKFQLKESLVRAQTNRLLEGYTVLVTSSVKPCPKDMKVIIDCAGGNCIMNWPSIRAQKELIVTCNQDLKRWKPIWNNDSAKQIDSDTFIMSIIRQKLNV